MIQFYYCRTSYASHKVMLYLAEKGLPYEPHHIDLRKQEHISSSYRQINPNGTVPSMIDEDGTVVITSTEIMERLESEHPKPLLLPSDEVLKRLIHEICIAHEKLHDPYIRTLSYAYLFMSDDKQSKLDKQRIIKLAKQHPNAERGRFLERAISGKLTTKEISESRQAVVMALLAMEEMLHRFNGGFVVGDAYSIADCVCTASTYRIEKVGMLDEIKQFARVAAWYEAMRQRPSFEVIDNPV